MGISPQENQMSPEANDIRDKFLQGFMKRADNMRKKIEKNETYSMVRKEARKEPLKLEDCANFVGMILTKNKRLK